MGDRWEHPTFLAQKWIGTQASLKITRGEEHCVRTGMKKAHDSPLGHWEKYISIKERGKSGIKVSVWSKSSHWGNSRRTGNNRLREQPETARPSYCQFDVGKTGRALLASFEGVRGKNNELS